MLIFLLLMILIDMLLDSSSLDENIGTIDLDLVFRCLVLFLLEFVVWLMSLFAELMEVLITCTSDESDDDLGSGLLSIISANSMLLESSVSVDEQ